MFRSDNYSLNRLFVMLRQFPIESRGRQKKLYEVSFLMCFCQTTFEGKKCTVELVTSKQLFVSNDLKVLFYPHIFYKFILLNGAIAVEYCILFFKTNGPYTYFHEVSHSSFRIQLEKSTLVKNDHTL